MKINYPAALKRVAFFTGARGTELPPPTFFELSIYIIIFNKNSLLSHLFYSYFNLFVSIDMQSDVNSNWLLKSLFDKRLSILIFITSVLN